jgi:hypothetical protein
MLPFLVQGAARRSRTRPRNAWLYDYDIERELDTVPTTEQEVWR